MSDYLKSYVKPIKIENIDEYYSLIQEISLSDTSRTFAGNLSHSAHINLLIKEISILLANSLRLYEMGYFDNAYYSLRSAMNWLLSCWIYLIKRILKYKIILKSLGKGNIINGVEKLFMSYLKKAYFLKRS